MIDLVRNRPRLTVPFLLVAPPLALGQGFEVEQPSLEGLVYISAAAVGDVADLDGDGLADLALIDRSGTGSFGWLRNLGAGAWSLPASNSMLTDPFPVDLAASGATFRLGDMEGDGDLDVLKRSPNPSLGWNRNRARFGDAYCGPAEANSSGAWGATSASGSREIADNDVSLIAAGLPPMTFGDFLIAPTEGFVPQVSGTQGNLCLAGPIGRLDRGPAEIFLTDAAGGASRSLDVLNVPTPTGAVALAPGETRYFQAWYRDAHPNVTSNFTNGMRIAFE